MLTYPINSRFVVKPYLAGLRKVCSSSDNDCGIGPCQVSGKQYVTLGDQYPPGEVTARISARRAQLLQLRVLRFGLLQDRNVRISVFPEGEEILIRGAGFGGVPGDGVGATQLEMRQCADGYICRLLVPHNT